MINIIKAIEKKNIVLVIFQLHVGIRLRVDTKLLDLYKLMQD